MKIDLDGKNCMATLEKRKKKAQVKTNPCQTLSSVKIMMEIVVFIYLYDIKIDTSFVHIPFVFLSFYTKID